MIYDFNSGHVDKFLRDMGVVKRSVDSVFKTFKNIDFAQQLDLGKAMLDENEAYVIDDNGDSQPVYFYKNPFYFYSKYHEGIQYPKFHILKCRTIKQHSGFKASNTRTVKVKNANRYHGEPFYEVEMKLCWNCAEASSNRYKTTADFYEALEEKYRVNNNVDINIKVDLNGYTLDWSSISKKYRRSKGFKCEKCSIDLSMSRQYLHVHHKDHIKVNVKSENLESLCALCHKHEDELHERNFEARKMKRQLVKYLERYKEELIRCENPYIHLY